MSFIKKNNLNFLIFLFLCIGFYISIQRGSNFSDGDAHDVILSFLNFIDYGIYKPSRAAYGHLVPEFIIGFFAYNFGTPISNLVCFLFFFSAVYTLGKTFKLTDKNLKLLLLLSLSNFLLISENTNSIDYPIALFFLSLGLFFLKKNKIILTSFFFGIAIVSRANFVIFIYPIILLYFLYNKYNKINLIKFFTIGLLTTLIGLLFFIPTLIFYDFSLNFISIPFLNESDTPGWYGGPALNIKSLLPRFLFKVYLILGAFSFFIFFYLSIFNFKKILNFKEFDNSLCIFIIFSNLLLFLFMPVKTLLLNPFIIFSYILIIKSLRNKIVETIIILNLLQWLISYSVLDIKYKNQDLCFAKEAISAEPNFQIKKGSFINFITDDNTSANCYSEFMGKYKKEFLNNSPLKLSIDTAR